VGKLSAVMVKALRFPEGKTRPVRFGDGDGLYIQVATGDTKSWLFRYTLRGKAREMGLGAVGEPPDGVPLSKARILACEMRAKLRQGIDPISDRQSERVDRVKADVEAAERTFNRLRKKSLSNSRSI